MNDDARSAGPEGVINLNRTANFYFTLEKTMTFFKRVKSLDDLKTQFRALAMLHHPDRGGELTTMQAVNAEYDSLYNVWNTRKASDEGYESAEQYRAGFYREQGWKGERYSDMSEQGGSGGHFSGLRQAPLAAVQVQRDAQAL